VRQEKMFEPLRRQVSREILLLTAKTPRRQEIIIVKAILLCLPINHSWRLGALAVQKIFLRVLRAVAVSNFN
jgi:hypothetical protein